MATHVRRLLDQVSDPSTKAAYSELCYKHAKDAATKALRIAPFAVTDTEALSLERLGITTSPFATTAHTHSADKILENDCLSLIGSYLPSDAVTHIQLKRSKLHLLCRGPNQDYFANYCHEPKDVLRYGITNPASCPRVNTQYAVLADTLHFMSTAQLMTLFARNPRLERLFATLVLPIEANHRLPSLFPDVYRLEYYNDSFAYMPGGHAGGAYVHSYGTLKWLSTARVGVLPNDILQYNCRDFLTLEKIETKAAHHVMLIQRRRPHVDWPPPTRWIFQASDYVRLPPIFYPPESNVQGTYPHTLVVRMQAYCFSVKAVSLRDIFAKLRQVIETAELRRYSMADLIRLANFLLFTTGMQQVSDYDSFLTKGLFRRMCSRIKARLRALVSSLTGKSSYAALLSVADVVPVHFTTKPEARPCQGAEWFTNPADDADDDEGEDECDPNIYNVVRAYNQKWEGMNPETHELASLPPAANAEDLDLLAEFDKVMQDQEDIDDHEPLPTSSSARSLDAEPSPPIRPDHAPSAPNVSPHVVTTDPTEHSPTRVNPETTLISTLSCSCGVVMPITTLPAPTHSFCAPDQLTGRTAGWYSKLGSPYQYRGGSHQSLGWPDWLQTWMQANGVDPQYDCCLYQCYDEGARIGYHADDEALFQPGSQVHTVNLEGSIRFHVKCHNGSGHSSLQGPLQFTMPKEFQNTHKHAVDQSSLGRKSVTFRVMRKEHATTEVNTTTSSDFDPKTTSLLKLHGFTALKTQTDGTEPIQPIYYNPTPPAELAVAKWPKGLPTALGKLANHLQRSFYTYKIDNKRATCYMSDVKNNLTGLVLPKLNREMLSAWVSLCECTEREVLLLVIHGAGGAGKSRAIQDLLRGDPDLAEDTNVIVPTVNLVLDWKRKMTSMEPKRFITFEKACEREGKTVAIFDDYGKLPSGYIDAYLAIKPTVELVILTGDQRQSVYHNANRDAQTASLPTNIDHFKKYCDYYVNATHRQPRRLANPINVHAERQLGGAVHRKNLIDDHATVLVPAHKTQTMLTDLGRNALTYSGCQGLTLPDVTIVLDNDTPLCSNEVLYTALSRASETITLVNTHSDNPEFLAKLDATPYLKTLISGVREDEDAGKTEPAPEPEVREPVIKTHLPVSNAATFLEDKVEAVEDKDTRELWDGLEKTNLMQTQDPVIQLFPHQQAKDEALFRLTIDQRIRTASPETNLKEITRTVSSGDLLFEAYAGFMKVPKEAQAFDKDLWDHCKQLALRTYLSKPKANLVQGATRQDPDFPRNAISLFNKSQWVKKLEKVGFKFKAGQTISAFKQETVALTATMALYLRKKREEHQPDNVFIMCEKTPSQFNDFVVSKWNFDRPAYTSDYTQYDQSQDAAFLNFELRKARHFGVPDDVLAFYKFIKTHAKTFVGNLAVMRLSGEGPTFDANTECNIAYDALRFQLTDKVMACYAGDDLVRDMNCPERPGWQYSQHLFSLQAKPLVTDRPDFCGWRLTKHGIVKSPIQLYQSLQLAVRLGRVDEVKRSYAIDYTYAYKLGDKLLEIFSEKELEAHQLATRLLIKQGMRTPDVGDHLPTFHITSDRLIRNPHYQEMHDAEASRIYLTAPLISEDHFSAPHGPAQRPRHGPTRATMRNT